MGPRAPSRLLYTDCCSCQPHRPRLLPPSCKERINILCGWNCGNICNWLARGNMRDQAAHQVCAPAVPAWLRPTAGDPHFWRIGVFFEGRCTSLDSYFFFASPQLGVTPECKLQQRRFLTRRSLPDRIMRLLHGSARTLHRRIKYRDHDVINGGVVHGFCAAASLSRC